MNEKNQQACTPADEQLSSENQKLGKTSPLDELFRATLAYRRSQAYFDLMKFISRFPKYAPFNCFLLHTQNPNLSYVATPFQWWADFERKIKPDSRPMVILVPFGPVSFVYDLADTEGKRLPRQLERPYETWGDHVPETVWYNTCRNCEERDQISILTKEFSPLQAGVATSNQLAVTVGSRKLRAKRIVQLNSKHTPDEQYVTLAHELAHIHCGHIGGDPDGWWPDRRRLGLQKVEFEAESVSFLVCSRLRLKTTAAEYLAWYTSNNEIIPDISLETVLKVAGYIESLGQKELELRKSKAMTAANRP
jgi:hypothetical protein